MRRTIFGNEHYYHIFNRGIEHRALFLEERDFERFYAALYLFNNTLYRGTTGFKFSSLSDVLSLTEGQERQPLVKIVSFCLMTNHFHLMVEQVSEDGISQFMHRLLMGYVKYFNKKYDRTGHLYEGTFRAVLVERDAQFVHLPRYIHLNALDRTDLPWRTGSIENWHIAERALNTYPWSSHHVYLGKPQLLPVVDGAFFKEMFPQTALYENFIKSWSVGNISSLRDVEN